MPFHRLSITSALLTFFLLGCSGGGGLSDDPATADTGNAPPTARADAGSTAGETVTLAVLANDSDEDGDRLSIMGLTAPAHGAASIGDNGTPADSSDDVVHYVPNGVFTGTERFGYTISDGVDGTASASIEIAVTGADPARQADARDDRGNTLIETFVEIPVLVNDIAGAGTLEITAVSDPAHGSAVIADNGSPADPADDVVVYAPDPGFTGNDVFYYTISNGLGSDTAAVNITVERGAPSPPVVRSELTGLVVKGPVSNATVRLYAVTPGGHADGGPALLETRTDRTGRFYLDLPADRDDLLVVASGGQFTDEADDSAAPRVISLTATDSLRAYLPAGDETVTVSPYTNALLLKARRDTHGAEFGEVFEISRRDWTTAFGLDLSTVLPVDPLNPDASASLESRQHALLLGGAAQALNAITINLALSEPVGAVIDALVRDLSDCRLDGADRDGQITVDIAGTPRPIASTLSLFSEVVRFRNNRMADFAATQLPAMSLSACTAPVAVPDLIAPVFVGVTPVLGVPAAGPGGTALTSAEFQDYLSDISVTDDRDGPVSFTHDAPATFPPGTTPWRFSASDAAGNVTQVTTDVIVTSGARPALITPIGALAGTEGVPFSYDLSAHFTDGDGDALSFAVSGLPGDFTVDAVSGVLTGIPLNADALLGPYTATVTASDGILELDAAFTLTVADVNVAPMLIAPIGTQRGVQDTTLALSLGDYFYDPENDPLTYSLSGLPAGSGLNFDTVTGSLGGTPNETDRLAAPLALTMAADDGNGSTSADFILTLSAANLAPRVEMPIPDRSFSAGIPLSIDLRAHFSDPNGDPLGITVSGLPAGSGLQAVGGVLSGVPNASDVSAAPIVLNVVASDGELSVAASFRLDAGVGNSPPVATPIGPQAGTQDVPLSLDLSGSFSDPDGDALSFSAAGLPPALNLSAAGVLSGTPDNAAAMGSPYPVTVTADDGALTVDDTFTLTIANVNDAPVATPIGPQAGTQDVPLSLDLSGSFSDPDGDALSFSAAGLPPALSLSAAGVLSGTPDNAAAMGSPYPVTVTAADGALTVDDTFTLTIANVNDAPVATPIGPQAGTQDVPLSLDLSGSFSDPDGDALSFSAAGLPPALSLSAAGVLSGTPDNAAAMGSPYPVTVTAADGALTVDDTFTLTIANVNDQPTATNLTSNSVAENAPEGTTVGLLSSVDPDTGDSHVYTLAAGAGDTDNASFAIAGNALITDVVLDFEAQSTHSIRVRTDDGNGGVREDVFVINVIDGNEPPTDIMLDNDTLTENAPAGTLVGLLNTVDLDPADTHTYSLAVGPGDDHNAWFTIAGAGADELRTTGPLDFETQAPTSIRIRTDDGNGGAFTRAYALTLVDANDAPELAAPIEDTLAVIGEPFLLDLSVHFSDQDLDTLTYGLTGLPVGSGLSFDTVTGVLSGIANTTDEAARPIVLIASAQDPLLESIADTFSLDIRSYADLEVTAIVDNATPEPADIITVTISIDNLGVVDSASVSVQVTTPVGLNINAFSASDGGFDPVSGVWNGFGVNNGSAETLQIDYQAVAAPPAFLAVDAVITGSSEPDPDALDSDTVDIVVVGAGLDHDWLGGDPGGPRDWNIGANWTLGVVPGPYDRVKIDSSPNDPILDSDRTVARVEVKNGATLDLAGNTLTVYAEARGDGAIVGPCPASRILMLAGELEGSFPTVEINGAVRTRGNTDTSCNLDVTSGRLRVRNRIDVAADLNVVGTGVLVQRSDHDVHVLGDVRFSGGDHSVPVSGDPPLKSGEIFVAGDFTQSGDPHAFAAEDNHTVIFNGPGPQTVYLQNPDNTNPDKDDPPLTGSRFAVLRVEKDTADGAIDFISNVAVLRSIEIDDNYSPTLTTSNGSDLIAGGAKIKDVNGPQTESAIFDGLHVWFVEGHEVQEFDGVRLVNMDPTRPQISIVRDDLKGLHDGKSFTNLYFETLPDFPAGGRYIQAANTDVDPDNELVLTVQATTPLHGLPWTTTINNFTILWGSPDDDTDQDALTDADEFVYDADPLDPDIDGDGVGDGVEVTVGGDLGVAATTVIYVDVIAGDDANGGTSWADALQTNAAVLSGPLAGLDGTSTDPVYVLLANGSYDPLSLNGKHDVVFVGSLAPGLYRPQEPIDTFIGIGASRAVEILDSQNILLHAVRLGDAVKTGGSGAGLLVGGPAGSIATLLQGEIIGNHADVAGGGFIVESGSTLELIDSLVRANSSNAVGTGRGGAGGAVYGSLLMQGSVIADNVTTGVDPDDGGGGLYIENTGLVNITDSLILANFAANSGAGLMIRDIMAPVTLRNNLIAGNAAEAGGGAAIEASGIDLGWPLLIESNTVVYNQALVQQLVAGGIGLSDAGFAEIRDNILRENDDKKLGDIETDNFNDVTGTALVEFNNIQEDPTFGANGNQDEDPLFEEGFYLDPTSPSVDAGSRTALAAGLSAPYTTDIQGLGDSAMLDLGWHHTEASLGDARRANDVSSACYNPGELTFVFTVEGDLGGGNRPTFGPGHLVSVAVDPLSPTGKMNDLSGITNFEPDGGKTRLAVDQGNGEYRIVIDNVAVMNDEVDLDVYVDNDPTPVNLKTPKTDTIPGC